MKQIIIFYAMLISILAGSCRSEGGKTADPASEGNADIDFREYEHHFGTVTEGEKLSWQFLFENKGTGDLVINEVSTTCGCTVPRYSKKPVSPGGKGTLEVIFDTSGRNGMQTKTITVKSNALKPVVLLSITAEVNSTNYKF